ncbi:MAG: DUF2283 domain-containing protein [Elusimicrobiota bacterium]
MKITYDEQADALYIQFQPDSGIKETIQIRDGIFCDIDKEGRMFGMEILEASQRIPLQELGKVSIDIPIRAA